MQRFYFFLSVTGLIVTTYSLNITSLSEDAFANIIVVALQVILLVISVVGIFMHYECVHPNVRKSGFYKTRGKI